MTVTILKTVEHAPSGDEIVLLDKAGVCSCQKPTAWWNVNLASYVCTPSCLDRFYAEMHAYFASHAAHAE